MLVWSVPLRGIRGQSPGFVLRCLRLFAANLFWIDPCQFVQFVQPTADAEVSECTRIPRAKVATVAIDGLVAFAPLARGWRAPEVRGFLRLQRGGEPFRSEIPYALRLRETERSQVDHDKSCCVHFPAWPSEVGRKASVASRRKPISGFQALAAWPFGRMACRKFRAITPMPWNAGDRVAGTARAPGG